MAEPTNSEKATAAKAPKKSSGGLDLASIGGLVLALAGILGGLIIEGGKIRDVAQFTAAMIVLGGTFGAVLVSTPLHDVIGAGKRFLGVFHDPSAPLGPLIEEVIGYATKARKNGLVSLETIADQIQ